MKRSRPLIAVIIGVAGVLGLAALAWAISVGLPALRRETVPTVTVKVLEGGMMPESVTVPLGQPFRLVLENAGAFPHEVAFYGLTATIRDRAPQSNAHYGAKAGDRAEPAFILRASGGKDDWIKIVATSSGAYEFACDLVGHKEMGNFGTLMVGYEDAMA